MGIGIGATKRGKGTKVMAISDGTNLPVAVHVASALPHEVTLAEETVSTCFVADEKPARLIGDKAYDSDPLDVKMAVDYGIELIAPHRLSGFHKRPKTQDGRVLRRYKRRWKIERMFAWLQNFRRILVRYYYYSQNYLGFVQLGCIFYIFLRLLKNMKKYPLILGGGDHQTCYSIFNSNPIYPSQSSKFLQRLMNKNEEAEVEKVNSSFYSAFENLSIGMMERV